MGRRQVAFRCASVASAVRGRGRVSCAPGIGHMDTAGCRGPESPARLNTRILLIPSSFQGDGSSEQREIRSSSVRLIFRVSPLGSREGGYGPWNPAISSSRGTTHPGTQLPAPSSLALPSAVSASGPTPWLASGSQDSPRHQNPGLADSGAGQTVQLLGGTVSAVRRCSVTVTAPQGDASRGAPLRPCPHQPQTCSGE